MERKRTQKVLRNRFTGEEYPVNSIEDVRASLKKINRPYRNIAAALLPSWSHSLLLNVKRPFEEQSQQ